MLCENKVNPTEAEAMRELKALSKSTKFVVVQKFFHDGRIEAQIRIFLEQVPKNFQSEDYDVYFEPFDTQKEANDFLEMINAVSNMSILDCIEKLEEITRH